MVQKLFSSLLLLSSACSAAIYANLPLSFEKYGEQGNFVSRAAGFNLLISNQEAVFALNGKPGTFVRMRVQGASSQARVAGEERLPGRANYLVGDRASWRTNVEQVGRVRIQEVLPETDLIYYGNAKQPEFDLVLRPGANVSSIRLCFDGAAPVLQQNGDLLLKTAAGEIVEHRPFIEQNGKRVEGGFRIEPDGTVGFDISAYDHSRELRIDPAITYSTYLGGTSNDSPNAIALDSAGNAYIAGSTSSFNFPVTPGALQTSYPGVFETVAFVAKLNATGTAVVYTTFLGGSGINAGDSANAIAVDSAGNAYVAGTTGSANFPVTNGSLSTTLSGPSDGFVAKLNATGTALYYSTYLGGSGQESVAGIAIDSSGDAYVAGSTGSINFPIVTGAPQTALKSANDAFVAKLNPAGSKLLYSTYLGGSAEDDAYAITVDSSGNAYVTGNTASTDFPVSTAAYKKTIGPAPVAFVAKVNAAGTALTYATYLGGTGGDSANAIAIDSSGNAYVAGTTASADFPVTSGVVGSTAPGISSSGHAFLSKLNPAGAALVYSTFLGGNGADGANGVAVDGSGNAVLTGFTYSTNFPASANSVDPVANFSPAAFLTQINPTATALIYSTLLGATGSTVGQGVAIDSSSHAFVTGYTGSFTFPVSSGAFQTANGVSSPGANTGFVARIDLGSATSCALSFTPTSGTVPVGGGSVTVSVVAQAGCAWEAVTGASWFSVNSPSSGIGPSAVTLTAGPNAMSQTGRSGTISAGAANYTLNQAGDTCSAPQFYPSTQTISGAGGIGSIAVVLPVGCTYAAASGAAWITISSGASGSGDDLVTFSVAANPSGSSRSGTLTIAGSSYTVVQTGVVCGTSLTPASSAISPVGGSLTATLITSAGCQWTSTSSANWLTVSPASGTGNSTLTLTAPANSTGNTLSSAVTAAGLSFSVTQAPNSPPAAVSVSPSSGTGTSQVFTTVFSEAGGASFISNRTVLINSALYGINACVVQSDATGIHLYNDGSSALLGPLSPSGSLSNSQCTLNGSGTTLTNSGTTSTLTLSITFNPAFGGVRNIYLYASDAFGNASGWQNVGTFTVATTPPSAVSVSPSTGVGISQVFTTVFSDAGGASLISNRTVLINSALYGINACVIQAGSTGIYLYNDGSSALLGPLSPSGTLSNSQCTLNGSGTSLTNSGTTSTLTLSIAFTSAFGGVRNIYLYASDAFGNSSGWQTEGTFTVATTPPTAVSVTPSAGSGVSQVFTTVFSDAGGGSLIANRTVLINSALYGINACVIQSGATGIYLYNDGSTAVLGPLSPTGTLANSQCTLNGSGTSLTNSGTTSTLTLSITFTSVFGGVRNIYMYASDIFGGSSGWQNKGTFAVATTPPTAVSVTPSAGSGVSQIFTTVFSDAGGGSLISNLTVLINSALYGINACVIQAGASGIYLYNDNSSAILGPLSPAGTLANSQCTLNGSGTSVTNSGTTSTLTLSISFTAAFGGVKNIYMYASDIFGNSSGWQNKGTFAVASTPPTAVSVTPSSGTGVNQVFTTLFSDAGGGSLISNHTVLINSALYGINACVIQADSTGIYLYNDNSSVLLGPLSPTGTLANSQCTLNGSGSSLTNSGTNSTLVLSINFANAFTGMKNVYMWVDDIFGNNSGWQTRGTYTVN